jgi:hypothetical protein
LQTGEFVIKIMEASFDAAHFSVRFTEAVKSFPGFTKGILKTRYFFVGI